MTPNHHSQHHSPIYGAFFVPSTRRDLTTRPLPKPQPNHASHRHIQPLIAPYKAVFFTIFLNFRSIVVY